MSLSAGGGGGTEYSACVSLQAGLTLANATISYVSWDTEQFDQGGLWDAGAPDRFTVPVTGRYQIQLWMDFAANGTGYREVGIQNLSTVTVIAKDRRKGDASFNVPLSVTVVEQLTAGQVIRGYGYQNSGGVLTADTTKNFGGFSIFKVG